MDTFITTNQEALIASIIVFIIFLFVRFIFLKAIRKVAKAGHFNEMRTRLVGKYIIFGLSAILLIILVFIWGIKFKDIGILLSSAFAIVGVAIFAQWSILSNVTAGVILFFSFPFKIGDHIRIHDQDLDYDGELLIEDIRAYHMHLRTTTGELLTYPNNMLLQKAVLLLHEEKDHNKGNVKD
ncbi:MAG: mechanosensitive ion channel family protein [Bacteroidia bacterium]|nr:mechanosensitive ion channel family protein [Bacteroidia bacterium]NND16807.1 mechanosensitive ion channel [Eudoraea sp.]